MTFQTEERKKEGKQGEKKKRRKKKNNFDIVQKLISNQITRHKVV